MIHRTTYHYPVGATGSQNEVRLMPLHDKSQALLAFELRTTPQSHIHWYEEPGGMVHTFGISEPHTELDIIAESLIETFPKPAFWGLNLIHPDVSIYFSESAREQFAEYLLPSLYVDHGSGALEFMPRIDHQNDCVANYMVTLCSAVHAFLEYRQDVTSVHTSVNEVVAIRGGVCQDFSHFMIACCRDQGIPARYVSGYLVSEGEEHLRGEMATHAWVEVPIYDELGQTFRWLSLDPTNNLVASDRYVRVHTGVDYSDVSPIKGTYIGLPASSMDVKVRVRRYENYDKKELLNSAGSKSKK